MASLALSSLSIHPHVRSLIFVIPLISISLFSVVSVILLLLYAEYSQWSAHSYMKSRNTTQGPTIRVEVVQVEIEAERSRDVELRRRELTTGVRSLGRVEEAGV